MTQMTANDLRCFADALAGDGEAGSRLLAEAMGREHAGLLALASVVGAPSRRAFAQVLGGLTESVWSELDEQHQRSVIERLAGWPDTSRWVTSPIWRSTASPLRSTVHHLGWSEIDDVRFDAEQVGDASQLASLRLELEGDLPEALLELRALRALDLSESDELTSVAGLVALPLLESLIADQCAHLEGLEALEDSATLHTLSVADTYGLQVLPRLPALTTLRARRCRWFTDLSSLASSPGLRTLDVVGCRRLETLAPLASCTQLQSLRVGPVMEGLQALGHLQLERLELSSAAALTSPGPLASAPTLRRLDLLNCSALQHVVVPAGLERLTVSRARGWDAAHLDLSAATELDTVILADLSTASLGRALTGASVRYLSLFRLPDLTHLDALTGMAHLEVLFLRDCRALTDLSALTRIQGLKKLVIEHCPGAVDVPWPDRVARTRRSPTAPGCV